MNNNPFLGAHFSKEVIYCFESKHKDINSLFPAELDQISNAIPNRQAEFATGRFCAKKSLKALGFEDVLLLKNEDGTPSWPKGVVGSISHSKCYALAAVSKELIGLGVDVETRTRKMTEEMAKKICVPQEEEWVKFYPPEYLKLLRLVIFSAKESLYKAVYPQLKSFIGFDKASVQLDEILELKGDECTCCFGVEFHPSIQQKFTFKFFRGVVTISRDLIVTSVTY